jgi:hypothetical protein
MNEDDVISQDDFLKAFGITGGAGQNDEGDQGNDDQQNTNTDPEDGANPGADNQNPDNTGDEGDSKDGDNTGDNKGNDDQNKDTNQMSKQSQAFAAMRVELSQKNKMLENVATVLGLDPKSKDSMNQLQTKLTEALAKKQGIPTETLERLNRLEELEQQRNVEQIRNNAFLGFQKVKTQFTLTDDELQSFANELVADGKNPFTTPLDLVTEYKLRNFDKLLAKAKEQGVQDEIARAAKASNNASTPGKKQGGAANPDADKITTVKQLNDWLNQHQSGK